MFDQVASVLTGTYELDTMFDGLNLTVAHSIASFVGAIMALYVMQLWTVGALAVPDDCWFSKQARRLALLMVALMMLWSLSYSNSKGWSPWPSDVGMMFAVDLFLLSSIVVAIKRRLRLKSAEPSGRSAVV